MHGRVVAALAWAHRQIDPWKQRVRTWARETVAHYRERLRRLAHQWGWRGNGRLWRRLVRLRRRTRRVSAAGRVPGGN